MVLGSWGPLVTSTCSAWGWRALDFSTSSCSWGRAASGWDIRASSFLGTLRLMRMAGERVSALPVRVVEFGLSGLLLCEDELFRGEALGGGAGLDVGEGFGGQGEGFGVDPEILVVG